MRSSNYKIAVIVLILITIFVSGCSTTPPTTGLYEKATHTGTATLLRVDESWHPIVENRVLRKVGTPHTTHDLSQRFVPLRHKGEISGIDGPENIVTNNDLVTISLKSSFIKYFAEIGSDTRKGEIALILSFDAGAEAKESVLIYSSQGQTLGSFLDLDDWPIIGPMKITGDSLLVRIVMIELDQQENEELNKFVRSLAKTGATLQPGMGSILSVAQPIVEFLINQNFDDVILDHRFSLQRTHKGSPPNRNALLFGKYVLLLQEDRLAREEVSDVASKSTLPLKVGEMRFDLHSDRVYKTYNYYPNPYKESEKTSKNESEEIPKMECPDPNLNGPFDLTYFGFLYEGEGPIDWASFYLDDKSFHKHPAGLDREYRTCLLEKWINSAEARKIRTHTLGYRKQNIGDFELYSGLNRALEQAYIEAVRYSPPGNPKSENGQDHHALLERYKGSDGTIRFEYPVVQYPKAYTLLAQYPLHTQIVFSIENSMGGEGGKFHEKFQNYVDFLQAEMQTAGNTRIGGLSSALTSAIEERQQQKTAFRKVQALADNQKPEKICILFKILKPFGTSGSTLSDAEIYTQMFHVTGNTWDTPTEVAGYLKNQNYVADESNFTCQPKNQTESGS